MGDIDFQAMEFAYEKHADQTAAELARHQVVVVGAGPVGLTTALDLARQGVHVVVLDDDYRLSTGSRAICFSKRTLEIWDRLGVGQRMIDKGVSWNVGKVFFREQEVWRFDLLPEPGHRRPAFINLQQYYAEGYLYEEARRQSNIELRWKNKVAGVKQGDDGASSRAPGLQSTCRDSRPRLWPRWRSCLAVVLQACYPFVCSFGARCAHAF